MSCSGKIHNFCVFDFGQGFSGFSRQTTCSDRRLYCCQSRPSQFREGTSTIRSMSLRGPCGRKVPSLLLPCDATVAGQRFDPFRLFMYFIDFVVHIMRLISRKEIVMWQLYGVFFETGFLSSPGLRRDRHIELQRLQPKRVESAPVPKHGISADLALHRRKLVKFCQHFRCCRMLDICFLFCCPCKISGAQCSDMERQRIKNSGTSA